MPSDLALSPHFHLSELTVSSVGERAGLRNDPLPPHIRNLQRLAITLEAVRSLLGDKPITVLSGFRSPAVNKAVGGADQSAHLQGLAADIICPAFGTPRQICERLIESKLVFDQLIQEGGRWVHIGLAQSTGTARQEVLTAVFIKGLRPQYRAGLL
jgi:zinc D-Ala-D-Ala carboxypeptidase